MESIYKDTIGTGVIFPIELTQNEYGKTGWYPITGEKLIEHNLCSMVSYAIGERFREEDFGTRLWECIDEPNTQALAFVIHQFLKESISKWEPRVTYKSSDFTREGSKIHIRFHYVINSTNASKSSIVTYNTNK